MRSLTLEQRSESGRKSIAAFGAMRLAGFVAFATACEGDASPLSPPPPPPTANVYVLPGAIDLGHTAFGNHPVVIYRGERMRWRNADTVAHQVVANTMSLPEFETTGALAPGAERSFVMNTLGTTPLHCAIHPQMTGTLVVREP